MERVPVGVGIDRDRADAGVLARAGDPDGDLATVGDQYLAHGGIPFPVGDDSQFRAGEGRELHGWDVVRATCGPAGVRPRFVREP
ncbi:hypothetical protein GCM10009839_79770 [Catenulispora yoronensis]|uniref:Uncharacterized protein n=1 Tax=Catenulispora yoronensis TaxID=450799 RepID=A0ABN2VB77_9ACTN